ncbi:hypothetical protein CRUP_006137 [Coryphaenoides rupestris]|nr:hypothetical protein CRUP_006137 [Coryphaenoides rupestris]
MLDRWSIMTYEIRIPPKHTFPTPPDGVADSQFHISAYEDSVAAHLIKILNSEQHTVVISLCQVMCKFKAHKRCAVRATNNCKWTTLASVGRDILEDQDGIAMPHQWLEGNLPVSAKCSVCDKTCGSVLRLQDWRCLWCKAMSGDNQGVKFLRRFKQLLNPAQVFDLVNGGPHLGLRLFQKFDNFRILLPQILEKLERSSTKMLDRWSIMTYEIRIPPKHTFPTPPDGVADSQFHISAYEDSVAAHLIKILNSEQHTVVIASAKILCETVKDFVAKVGKAYEKSVDNAEECDSMSIKCAILNEKLDSLLLTLNGEVLPPLPHSTPPIPEEEDREEEEEEDGGGMEEEVSEESLTELKGKLEEEETEKGGRGRGGRSLFKSKEQLMLRANSLKKAVRQIILQAERVVDEQNADMDDTDRSSAPDLHKDGEEENEENQETAARTPCPPVERRVSRSTQSCGSFCITPFTTSKENLPVLNTRIICPATSFIDPDLDSLLVLSSSRSRTKNMMWYGVLGTKELLQRTYKNLEQRVQLECDGQYIPLPSLQGIAVLNIPSYAGGTNFWGGTKEDDIFCAPSFDDKILEVVAVFGSMQMAVSRVIKLQHHRIAQCRTVKITILGDEGVPIQVDGEAWVQPPGVIKIQHKNRAQMLTRDRAFENTLKSWEDKLKYERPPLRPHLYPQQSVDLASEEETALLQACARGAEELITRICEAAQTNGLLEQELAHAVNAASHAINKTHPKFPESLTRNTAIEVASTVKALHNETESLLVGRVSLQLEALEEEQLSAGLQGVELELAKLAEVTWLSHVLQPHHQEDQCLDYGKVHSRPSMFRIVPKFKKERAGRKTSPQSVQRWGTEEVGAWLEQLTLGEYRDTFSRHDIRGSELLHLERRDLKDLGISKVGHMKRILQGTKDLAKTTMVDL